MKILLKLLGWVGAFAAFLLTGALLYIKARFKSFPGLRVRAEKTSLTEEEIFSWIREIVAFGPRKPASEADEKTRVFIAEKFAACGLNVAEPEPLEVDTAKVEGWGLWLKDPDTGEETAVSCYPLPFPAPTPTGGLDAELVYVGDGRDMDTLDVARKIVVFEQQTQVHNWNLYRRLFYFYDPARSVPKGYSTTNLLDRTERVVHDAAVSRGAVGLIGLLSSLQWESDTFCPQLNHGVKKDIPGVWVGPKHAATIRKAAEATEAEGQPRPFPRPRARLLVKAEQGRSETYNIWATLPGEVDEYYVVMGHHDAPFANAVQDASGLSVVLALAKHFSEVREQKPLRRGIVFLAVGGHTLGRLGERAFAHRHRSDLLPKVALAVSIEHIAKEFLPSKDLQFACSEQPAIRMFFTAGSRQLNGIVQSSIIRNDYRRSVMMPQWVVKKMSGKARGISGELYEAGVPVVGLLSNPPYMFFQEDTPATVARDQLVPTADLIVSILRAADTLPMEAIRE